MHSLTASVTRTGWHVYDSPVTVEYDRLRVIVQHVKSQFPKLSVDEITAFVRDRFDFYFTHVRERDRPLNATRVEKNGCDLHVIIRR